MPRPADDKGNKGANPEDDNSKIPRRRLLDIFLAAATGAAGTAIVGLVFSSTTISWITEMFGKSVLPRNAIVFVNGSDCGDLGDGWSKFELAQGRFVVGAGDSPDGVRFQAGLPGNGRSKIKINQQNLPKVDLNLSYTLTNIDISGHGYDMPRAIGSGDRSAKIPLGGNADEIETLPSWIALTACQRR